MNPHLSEEQISRYVAGERAPECEQHLGGCTRCAGEVQDTQQALLMFRQSGYECAAHWQQHPQRPLFAWRRVLAAACACAVFALALAALRRPNIVPAERQVFVRIPYVIPPAPYERTKIVRMDVPVAALLGAGLRLDVTGAAERVRADVLVAQDGRPLAVSLISGGESR